jgi:DNA-binding NarL/FixJ family response regulator
MSELLADNNHSTEKIINILVVDDHPLVRQALKNIIGASPGMAVVGEACNGKEAVILAEKLMPDMIIMDIGMPVMNGLEATRQIKACWPNISILVLTVHTDKEHILGILEAGAAGYLTKVLFGNEIIQAIRGTTAGEAILSSSILQEILSSVSRETIKTELSDVYNNLTTQEIQLVKFVAKGLSNKNIAVELNLSEHTIKSYLSNIFQKMRVGSRTEAVVTGLKAGFIRLSDLG